eukprot:s760_g7.t1
MGPSPEEAAKVHSRGMVYEKPKSTAGAATPDPTAPDVLAVSCCRRGELPPSGWSSKWSPATKRASLLAALEERFTMPESQMHVVYALRPHSEMWQESVRAVQLDQAELDRLLREKVATKPRPTLKQRPVKDAIQWLLEAGASLEALCSDGNPEATAMKVSEHEENPLPCIAAFFRIHDGFGTLMSRKHLPLLLETPSDTVHGYPMRGLEQVHSRPSLLKVARVDRSCFVAVDRRKA